MHIAVLSDREVEGGANIAASRLTEGLLSAGHRITRIYQRAVTHQQRYETHLIHSLIATHEFGRAKRVLLRLAPDGIRRSVHQQYSAIQLRRILKSAKPDVINVHNLHMAGWSPEMIAVCASHAPTVCTLHDTWTFTGRCYNTGTCDKYLTGCDHLCPTAHEYPALKPSRIRPDWELRKRILEGHPNVAAVVPSRWLGRMATAGLWKNGLVFRVPLGIDLDRYAPIDRSQAQVLLGLKPVGAPVLLCAATDLNNRKKGVHLLLEALSHGLGTRVQLLLLGSTVHVPDIPKVEIHHFGYVQNDRLKAILYNAADVYVHSSLADNAPNVVIESLACGTPVVAFPVDGLPEMVIPHETGWLARHSSSVDLRMALTTALSDLGRGLDLRSSCRNFANVNYDLHNVSAAYERVYARMLAGHPDSHTEALRIKPGGLDLSFFPEGCSGHAACALP